MNGGIEQYGFHSRKEYLAVVQSCPDYRTLREWMLHKLEDVCRKIATKREEQSESIISKAKTYIDQNFSKELTLDEVSRSVNISPYYFSRIFKKQEDVTPSEYRERL